MTSKLFDYQKKAVGQLKTGSILCGGVGSGKSLTALAYVKSSHPPWSKVYVITTAKKRDTGDWEREAKSLGFLELVVDSWNNIKKYIDVTDSFVIFDEQRVVGSGAWVKSFLKITSKNDWILLTATPGDTWMDYVPVFIANGFYKNRSQFLRRHVVFSPFTKFPKISRYVDTDRLEKIKSDILVMMDYKKPAIAIYDNIYADFDKDKFSIVQKKRWNPYTNKPIRDITEYFLTMRKVVNSDPSRFAKIEMLVEKHSKLIVFYNFNYELELLRELKSFVTVAEYNGHKHEAIPETDRWVYLVQYLSGSEGWNCIETNAVAFYSLNYSYRIMTQAAGRIDRLNTPFAKLFYYKIMSASWIDKEINKVLLTKKNFNQSRYKHML